MTGIASYISFVDVRKPSRVDGVIADRSNHLCVWWK